MLHNFVSFSLPTIIAGLGDCQSSPGWLNQPQDVAILEGGSITFYCRNSIAHTVIRWLKDGKTVTSASTSKLRISQDRRSASYGPVAVEDDDVSIGCEVDTVHYGTLPSQMGKIKVYCELNNSLKPSNVCAHIKKSMDSLSVCYYGWFQINASLF